MDLLLLEVENLGKENESSFVEVGLVNWEWMKSWKLAWEHVERFWLNWAPQTPSPTKIPLLAEAAFSTLWRSLSSLAINTCSDLPGGSCQRAQILKI